MTDREIFKNNLNNLIRTTKVKQIDVAKYAEVSYQTVSAWTKGRVYPRADAMEKLCRFFGVKISDLTEDKTNKTQEQKLLDAFRSLSGVGKDKALERVNELVLIYPKRGSKNG